MLGLIEINLLPPEYRQQDHTPLPLFLSVVVGICLLGGGGLWWLEQAKSLKIVQEEVKRLEEDKAVHEAKKKEIEALAKEIDDAKKRQEEIRKLSAGIIIWSQKMVQFSQLLKDCPLIWVDSIRVSTGGRGGGGMDLKCSMAGQDIRHISYFRDRIQNDASFFYHFGQLSASKYTYRELRGMNFPSMVAFSLDLKLKEEPKKKKKRR